MTDDRCVCCSIVRGRTVASVIHEDESVLAFMDLRPVNPGFAGDPFRVQADWHTHEREQLDRSAAAVRRGLAALNGPQA